VEIPLSPLINKIKKEITVARRRKLSKEEKLQKVIDDISNCHPDVIKQIMSLDPNFVEDCTFVGLTRYVRKELLRIEAPLNRSTKEYWLKRGWSERESKIKSKENGKKFKKDFTSPFSKEHWIKKGYSEEEAEYIRNSKRPIRKEYWLEKGYSEEESILKAKQHKDSNNKKGAKKNAERSPEDHRKDSPRCIEFYIERGYSEEAKEKLYDFQNNFTIEKCIERYGMDEGIRKWEDRQERWQNTLKNKPENETHEMNRKKDSVGLKNFTSIEECIKTLKEKRSMDIFADIDSFMIFFVEKIKQNPYMIYWTIDKIMSTIPKVQKEIIDPKILENEIKPLLKSREKYLIKKTGKQAYRKWEDEGLLRSSYEIYFFESFKNMFPEKKIKIDNCYPNSNFRYDFLVNDNLYVEIAPEYDTNESYRYKMEMKEKVFGCIILKTIYDIDDFLESLE
jgi:hypothetical protein